MSSVTIITGSYPSDTPDNLASNVLERPKGNTDVNVILRSTASSETVYLLGYDESVWCPIGSIIVDQTVTGGVALGRFTPGNSFSHYALWRASATATLDVTDINFTVR